MAPTIWELHAAIDVVLGQSMGDWLEAAGVIEEYSGQLSEDSPTFLLIESHNNEPDVVHYGFEHETVGRYAVSRSGRVITLSHRDEDLTPGQLTRHFLFLEENAVHSVVTVRYRSRPDYVVMRAYLSFRAVVRNVGAIGAFIVQYLTSFGTNASLEAHSYSSESYVPDIAVVRHSLRDVPIGVEFPAAELEAMDFW